MSDTSTIQTEPRVVSPATDVNGPATSPEQQPNTQAGGAFHHISDVDTWKHPDRNYWVFVALTVFTGFIGLDHFYLRSNETAIKKLLVNIFGLGFWYFYDLIQVFVEGNKVRKEGLSSPLDWIQGIGRGMFEAKKKEKGKGAEAGPEWEAPKSYMLYTILATALGVFGADKFYLGQNFQGMVKFISVFSIIFTIFGVVWVVYDAIMAVFFTESLLKKGIQTPPPFSMFFRKPLNAKELFEVQEIKKEEKKPFSIWNFVPFFSFFKSIGGAVPMLAKEIVEPLVSPSACAVMKHAQTAQKVGGLAMNLGTSTLGQIPGIVGDLTGQMADMVNPENLKRMIEPTPAQILSIAQKAQAARVPPIPAQMGGGNTSSSGAGPVLAGTLTALILAGGLKGVYDFLDSR